MNIVHFRNQLEPDKLGESYLDMSQYYRLFGTIRTPGPNCDELTLNPDSRHIIVAHNNQVSFSLIHLLESVLIACDLFQIFFSLLLSLSLSFLFFYVLCVSD